MVSKLNNLNGMSRIIISVQMFIALLLIYAITNTGGILLPLGLAITCMIVVQILSKVKFKKSLINEVVEILLIMNMQIFLYSLLLGALLFISSMLTKSIEQPLLTSFNFVLAIWILVTSGYLVTGISKLVFKIKGVGITLVTLIGVLIIGVLLSYKMSNELNPAYVVPYVLAVYVLLFNTKVWENSIVMTTEGNLVLSLDLYLFDVKGFKYETLDDKVLIYGGTLCSLYNIETVTRILYSFHKQK